jgi:hypothetical protein
MKKYLLFTVGSVCPLKRFTTWSRNSLKDVKMSHMMPNQMRKWLRQQWKLLFCGFRCTGKEMGKVYQCWWRISPGLNITCSTFSIHLWPIYWSSLVLFRLWRDFSIWIFPRGFLPNFSNISVICILHAYSSNLPSFHHGKHILRGIHVALRYVFFSTSSYLIPNINLSALLLNILAVREQISHPYKNAEKL